MQKSTIKMEPSSIVLDDDSFILQCHPIFLKDMGRVEVSKMLRVSKCCNIDMSRGKGDTKYGRLTLVFSTFHDRQMYHFKLFFLCIENSKKLKIQPVLKKVPMFCLLEDDTCNIFVDNVPADAKLLQLEKLFSSSVGIEFPRNSDGKNQGYAIAKYKKQEHVDPYATCGVLQLGHNFLVLHFENCGLDENQPINENVKQKYKQAKSVVKKIPDSNIFTINNVPPYVTSEKLYAMFPQAKQVYILKGKDGKRYASIKVSSAEEAKTMMLESKKKMEESNRKYMAERESTATGIDFDQTTKVTTSNQTMVSTSLTQPSTSDNTAPVLPVFNIPPPNFLSLANPVVNQPVLPSVVPDPLLSQARQEPMISAMPASSSSMMSGLDHGITTQAPIGQLIPVMTNRTVPQTTTYRSVPSLMSGTSTGPTGSELIKTASGMNESLVTLATAIANHGQQGQSGDSGLQIGPGNDRGIKAESRSAHDAINNDARFQRQEGQQDKRRRVFSPGKDHHSDRSLSPRVMRDPKYTKQDSFSPRQDREHGYPRSNRSISPEQGNKIRRRQSRFAPIDDITSHARMSPGLADVDRERFRSETKYASPHEEFDNIDRLHEDDIQRPRKRLREEYLDNRDDMRSGDERVMSRDGQFERRGDIEIQDVARGWHDSMGPDDRHSRQPEDDFIEDRRRPDGFFDDEAQREDFGHPDNRGIDEFDDRRRVDILYQNDHRGTPERDQILMDEDHFEVREKDLIWDDGIDDVRERRYRDDLIHEDGSIRSRSHDREVRVVISPGRLQYRDDIIEDDRFRDDVGNQFRRDMTLDERYLGNRSPEDRFRGDRSPVGRFSDEMSHGDRFSGDMSPRDRFSEDFDRGDRFREEDRFSDEMIREERFQENMVHDNLFERNQGDQIMDNMNRFKGEMNQGHRNMPNQKRGGFQNNRGGFQNQRGGFKNQRGGFQNQRGGFQNQRGGFQNQRGGFQKNFRGNTGNRFRGQGNMTRQPMGKFQKP